MAALLSMMRASGATFPPKRLADTRGRVERPAMASPNGSGSRTGNRSARASASNSPLRSFDTSPWKITRSESTYGRIRSSKNHASLG